MRAVEVSYQGCVRCARTLRPLPVALLLLAPNKVFNSATDNHPHCPSFRNTHSCRQESKAGRPGQPWKRVQCTYSHRYSGVGPGDLWLPRCVGELGFWCRLHLLPSA